MTIKEFLFRPAPINWFRSAWGKFLIDDDTVELQADRLIMIAWLAIVGFPLYYWVWAYLFPQQYESFLLRFVGMVIVIPFLLVRKLHKEAWFKTYFFVAITYALPFFFSFMFFMNNASSVWSQSLLIAIFLLFNLEGKIAALSLAVGTALAYLTYGLTTGGYGVAGREILIEVPIIAFVILVAPIVRISRGILVEEKLHGVASALGVISHELRTPLRSVDANARGLKRYLPVLVEFYEKHHQEFKSEALHSGRLVMMDAALDRIQAEVKYMNSAIDLLLANASESRKKAQITQIFQINDVIAEAIKRYPFENEQQCALVTAEVKANYVVSGNKELCIMVLFNLLKNALRAVAKAGKGEIRMTTTSAAGENQLMFRDTGCGIPDRELPNIFRRFYTCPHSAGTGIGLAFCRNTLEAWGAKISCRSQENEYTEFVIQFPVVESNRRVH